MRSGHIVVALGALLFLRCSSYGNADEPTVSPPANDGGLADVATVDATSTIADAAPDTGSDIVTTPLDPSVPCSSAEKAVVGIKPDAFPTAVADDSVVAGTADAYSYQVASSAVARCAHVFVQERGASGTIGVLFAIYSNHPTQLGPDKLLARATFPNVTDGINSAHLDQGVSAIVGTRLWIAIVPTSSSVTIAIDKGPSCLPQQGGLVPKAVPDQKLPSLWGTVDTERVDLNLCNARFFASE